MPSSVEQFPIELWLKIFSYLEAHDLVKAFDNLNSYFRSILASHKLRLHVEINSKDIENTLSTTSIWSIIPLESIRLLTAQTSQSNLIVEFLLSNSSHLKHLTFLDLDVKSTYIKPLASILVNLVCIKTFSLREIQEVMNEEDKTNIFPCILRMHSLKQCILDLSSSKFLSTSATEQDNQPVNQTIKQLCINIGIKAEFFLFLIRHLLHVRLLRLQHLFWSESVYSLQGSLQSNIVAIVIGTANISFINLQRLIQTNPHLRCLHIIDWHMRDSDDKDALLDGRLHRLLDGIACIYVGTVLEAWDTEQDEMRAQITARSWLKHTKNVQCASNMPVHDRVIIIGGSIGGMMVAACLSKYFKRIAIIESDNVLNETLHKSTPDQIFDYRCRLANPASIGRSGVGQIYQIHVLQNIEWLGIDRFTLETAMRKELCLQFGNQTEWITNARLVELIADRSANVVHGTKYRLKDSSSSLDIYGNFIIDCTGRNTSSTKWLKESLNLIVPTVQMHFGCGYVTFVGERFKTGDSSLDSKPIYFSNANVPDNNTGCYISPVRTLKSTDENSLGILSTIAVNCVNAEYPPNDSYENLLDWVKEHLDRDFTVILNSTKLCSPLVSHHRAIDDRKYVESLGKKWPRNYIL
ncbi:unnamed protein product [Rotaria socialis]|uniref:F-box domain-containing protein n=3 Tax=Rotaria socialis TaxID=392032 RepID=A0A821H195_9BILA|nr:unnamed protein product [Rotaria socialis]